MKTIQYRIQYTGAVAGGTTPPSAASTYEVVTVEAHDINNGFGKALRHANDPFGNGVGFRREIGAIKFWSVL